MMDHLTREKTFVGKARLDPCSSIRARNLRKLKLTRDFFLPPISVGAVINTSLAYTKQRPAAIEIFRDNRLFDYSKFQKVLKESCF